MFFILLIFHIIFSFCSGMHDVELISYALSMSSGPPDIIEKYLNIEDTSKIQFVDKKLYQRWSLIFRQKIKREVEETILPNILASSFFSSYVLNTIRNHVLIPKIDVLDKKNTEMLVASFKKYLNVFPKGISNSCESDWLKENLDKNREGWAKVLNKISKNINQPVTDYIQKNVVPYYFVFNRQYAKVYENIVNFDENELQSNIGYFFNHYGYKVSIEKTKIHDVDVPIVTWDVIGENNHYKIFDIPHVNKFHFNSWLSNIKLESNKSISYMLLFRLPIEATQLSEDDKKIKIKQIENIIKKIKEHEGTILHLSIGGYNTQDNIDFDGIPFEMLQGLQEKNIHKDISKIYVHHNTIENLYNSLKQNKFIMSEDSKNIYDKIRTIYEKSVYDIIYDTQVEKSTGYYSETYLTEIQKENFVKLLPSIKYNFHYNVDNLFERVNVNQDNYKFIAYNPFFWIHDVLYGFGTSAHTDCIKNQHKNYIKKCAAYDLYSIVHNYLMCRYALNLLTHISNCYLNSICLKSSLFDNYLSSLNHNGLIKFICKQFIENPNIVLNENLTDLIKDLFNRAKWSARKKSNFILHLCAQSPTNNTLTKAQSFGLVQKSGLKFSLKVVSILKQKIDCLLFDIVPKIIAIEDLRQRVDLLEKHYDGLGKKMSNLVKEIKYFFWTFPQLQYKNVLYSDLELENIINKFFLLIEKNNDKPIDTNFDFLNLFEFLLSGCQNKYLSTSIRTKICCKLYTTSYAKSVFHNFQSFKQNYSGNEKKIRYVEVLINFLGKNNSYYSKEVDRLFNDYNFACKDLEKNFEIVEQQWNQEKGNLLFEQEKRKKAKYDSMLKEINKIDRRLSKKPVRKKIEQEGKQERIRVENFQDVVIKQSLLDIPKNFAKNLQELPFLENSKQKKLKIQPKKLPKTEDPLFLEEQPRIENDLHHKARDNKKSFDFLLSHLLFLVAIHFMYDIFKDLVLFFKKYTLRLNFSFSK